MRTQISLYWCDDCKSVHAVKDVEPSLVLATGFTYIKQLNATLNVGYCKEHKQPEVED